MQYSLRQTNALKIEHYIFTFIVYPFIYLHISTMRCEENMQKRASMNMEQCVIETTQPQIKSCNACFSDINAKQIRDSCNAKLATTQNVVCTATSFGKLIPLRTSATGRDKLEYF